MTYYPKNPTKKKYLCFFVILLLSMALVWIFGLEEEGQIKSGVRHFLKAILRNI